MSQSDVLFLFTSKQQGCNPKRTIQRLNVFFTKYPKIVWVVSLKGCRHLGGYIGAPTCTTTKCGTVAAMAQALFHASGSPFIVWVLAEELFNRRTPAHTYTHTHTDFHYIWRRCHLKKSTLKDFLDKHIYVCIRLAVPAHLPVMYYI